MRTAAVVLALALVGAILAVGAWHRAEATRTAYRVQALSGELAALRNENRSRRGRIGQRSTLPALLAAAARLKIELPVAQIPVVAVVRRDFPAEEPGA